MGVHNDQDEASKSAKKTKSSKSRKFIKFSPRLRKKSRSKENAAVKTGSDASMEASRATTRDHSLQIPNGLNEKEKQELESVFEMFDKNKDGKISCGELGVVLRTLGHRYSHAEIEDMIKNADKNDNGFVEYDEFVLLMKRASVAQAQEKDGQEEAEDHIRGEEDSEAQKKNEAAATSKQKTQLGGAGAGTGAGAGAGAGAGGSDVCREAREAFEIFDVDGNGFIDRDELRYIMTRLGENPGDEDICEMFRHADLNGDGLIDYTEFTRLMDAMTHGIPKKPSGRSPSSKSKSKKK